MIMSDSPHSCGCGHSADRRATAESTAAGATPAVSTAAEAAPAEPASDDLATDPVCGMKVKRATAKYKTEYGGEAFYFCNPKCLAKFDADPAPYLAKRAAAHADVHGADH